MSIKAFLAQQEVTFISAHELIERLMQLDGATRKQAAAVLYQVITQAPDDEVTWLRCTPSLGISEASLFECKQALKALKEEAEPSLFDDDDIPF